MNYVPRLLVFAAMSFLAEGIAPVGYGQETPSDAPSMVLRISEDLLVPSAGRPVDRVGEVNSVMLGTHVRGTSHTQGTVTTDLQSSDENAGLVLTFKGENRSQTIGRNGPAIIYAHTITEFVCHREVHFDLEQGGFVAVSPCDIQTKTNVIIDRVESTQPGIRNNMIQRIAWRRIARAREQIDSLTTEDVKRQVCDGFTKGVDEYFVRLNRRLNLAHRLAASLHKRTDLRCRFSSTDDYLQVTLAGGENAPAAPAAPRSSPVELWVHSSLLNRSIATFLKPRWLVPAQATPFRLTSFVGNEPAVTTTMAPFSVAFDAVDEWVLVRVAVPEMEPSALQLTRNP